MQLTWKQLISRHQKKEGIDGLQQAIDELIDESTSAFKFLLPDLSNKDILYIGCDHGETSMNLAKSCREITAIFICEQCFATQQEKNLLRKSQENLKLIHLEPSQFCERMQLPFPAQKFDGVVIDHTLENIDLLFAQDKSKRHIAANLEEGRNRQLEFLHEIKRVVKPNGWIFLKCKNRYNRDVFLRFLRRRKLSLLKALFNPSFNAPCECARKSYLSSTYGYKKLLDSIGFSTQHLFGFERFDPGVDRIIDMTQTEQISRFKKHKKFRWLPLWLYRLSVPTIGILASIESTSISILDHIVQTITNQLSAKEDYQILSMEINRKGKFLVTLDLYNPQRQRSILKLPLSRVAEQHMQHNYAGLRYAREAMAESAEFGKLPAVLPKPLCWGEYKDTRYFVESCVPGMPFMRRKPDREMSAVINQIIGLLKEWQQLPCTESSFQNRVGLPHSGQLQQQIRFIRDYVAQYEPDMLESFDCISLQMIQEEVDAPNERYLFKSDCSVSNALIENDNVSGLIDFDFWGISYNRLVDYADFVFSFTRNFHDLSYDEVLVMINLSKLSSIVPILRVEETINILGGSEKEFISASRIAWINSVYHMLGFERTRLNSDRTKIILFDPINKLIQLNKESRTPL